MSNGFHKISLVTGRSIEPIIKSKGFLQTKIITDWSSIVGDELAKFSMPSKINQDADKKYILTIDISNGAKATEFSYIHDFILEKVNSYFGYKAVKSIKVQQVPTIFCIKNKSYSQQSLTKEQNITLDNMIYDIGDDELKNALHELGKLFYTDSR